MLGGPARNNPAHATSTSIRPNRSKVRAAISAISSGRRTSSDSPSSWSPGSTDCRRRPTATTLAPAARAPRHTSSPMPLVAPVTTTTESRKADRLPRTRRARNHRRLARHSSQPRGTTSEPKLSKAGDTPATSASAATSTG